LILNQKFGLGNTCFVGDNSIFGHHKPNSRREVSYPASGLATDRSGSQVKLHNKNDSWFRHEGKKKEERNLGIFKDIPMINHINGELSTRPFH